MLKKSSVLLNFFDALMQFSFRYCLLVSDILSCVVVKIALNIDDWGALIAGTRGQVSQRADEVSQAAWGSALCHHSALEILCLFVLIMDIFLDCVLERITGQVCKIVICKVFKLDLIRSAFKT